MRIHNWSNPVVVYESLEAYVCSECGSCVLTDDRKPNEACSEMRVPIPLDCDKAKNVEGRSMWEDDLPWFDGDKPTWSSGT